MEKYGMLWLIFAVTILVGCTGELMEEPSTNNQKIMEPQSAISDSLQKGETRTYNLDGTRLAVTLDDIGGSGQEKFATFIVNDVATEPLHHQEKHISEEPKFLLQVIDIISTEESGLVSFSLSEERTVLSPSKCTFGPQFGCTDWSVTEDGFLTIRIQNNVGSAADVQLFFSGYDCETETEVFAEVRNGRAVSINDEALAINCGKAFTKREWFSADIIAKYWTEDDEPQISRGFIQTKVR